MRHDRLLDVRPGDVRAADDGFGLAPGGRIVGRSLQPARFAGGIGRVEARVDVDDLQHLDRPGIGQRVPQQTGLGDGAVVPAQDVARRGELPIGVPFEAPEVDVRIDAPRANAPRLGAGPAGRYRVGRSAQGLSSLKDRGTSTSRPRFGDREDSSRPGSGTLRIGADGPTPKAAWALAPTCP